MVGLFVPDSAWVLLGLFLFRHDCYLLQSYLPYRLCLLPIIGGLPCLLSISITVPTMATGSDCVRIQPGAAARSNLGVERKNTLGTLPPHLPSEKTCNCHHSAE